MLRIATLNDVNGIKAVENRCFSTPWSENMIISSIESGCIMIVAEVDNNIIGYAGVYPSGDITNVAVLPSEQGKGYGTELVKELINIAKINNIEKLFLEVRVSNIKAIKLYEKCGFEKISVRKKYYKDGEDALIYAFGGV